MDGAAALPLEAQVASAAIAANDAIILAPAPLTHAAPDARVAVAELLAALAGGAVVELQCSRLKAVAFLGALAQVVRVADRPVGAVAAVDGAVRAAGNADAGVAAISEQAAVVLRQGRHVERRPFRRLGILESSDDEDVSVGSGGRRRSTHASGHPHYTGRFHIDTNPHLALVDVDQRHLKCIDVARLCLTADDEHVVLHGNGAVEEPEAEATRRRGGLSPPSPPPIPGYLDRKGLRGRGKL